MFNTDANIFSEYFHITLGWICDVEPAEKHALTVLLLFQKVWWVGTRMRYANWNPKKGLNVIRGCLCYRWFPYPVSQIPNQEQAFANFKLKPNSSLSRVKLCFFLVYAFFQKFYFSILWKASSCQASHLLWISEWLCRSFQLSMCSWLCLLFHCLPSLSSWWAQLHLRLDTV